MCKIVYRIRSLVAYTWDGNNSTTAPGEAWKAPIKALEELYCHDSTFALMIRMVRKHLTFLFEGTDINHQVINDAKRPKLARVPRRLDKVALETWQIAQGYRS